jgi:cyclic pyranopterin phosphate synthase
MSMPIVGAAHEGESRDQFGRKIEYLRISVTDRCNFRCQYCMPLEGLPWLPKAEILRYEEIADVVRQLAPMGLRRLRITGGEPTIRPQLATLVRMLRDIPGIEDIALSTNGVKLPTMSAELAEAGLDRVNISADSLRPDRVVKIARRDLHFDLVASARAAQAAGLGPIKITGAHSCGRCAGARCGAGARERPRRLLPLSRCGRHGRGHHAHDPHVL